MELKLDDDSLIIIKLIFPRLWDSLTSEEILIPWWKLGIYAPPLLYPFQVGY